MNETMEVLDVGSVRLVESMGNTDSVVQAARTSHGSGIKGVEQDNRLIRYLLKHAHGTPFEMLTYKFHVKCPIFVARQWFRHRVASYNEISARYEIPNDEFYIPDHFRKQDNENRQGSVRGEEGIIRTPKKKAPIGTLLTEMRKNAGIYQKYACEKVGFKHQKTLSRIEHNMQIPTQDEISALCAVYGVETINLGQYELESEEASETAPDDLLALYISATTSAKRTYDHLLENGVAREMARMVLPQCIYTEFYTSINARSLMNFLSLRLDEGAQWEIRQYAESIHEIVLEKDNRLWAIWNECGRVRV